MRNVTVALGSFIVGAISMFLLGNHTSTFAQSPQGLAPPGLAINIDGTPTVPPFKNISVEGSHFTEDSFRVAGVLCRRCVFDRTILLYGGGEFSIVESQFVSPPSIQLTGAASNTAVFLSMFGLLGCPANNAPHTPPQNKAPMLKAKFVPSGDLRLVSSK